MARGYTSGLMTGMAVSLVAAVLAPVWRPAISRWGRPAAKSAIRWGLEAYQSRAGEARPVQRDDGGHRRRGPGRTGRRTPAGRARRDYTGAPRGHPLSLWGTCLQPVRAPSPASPSCRVWQQLAFTAVRLLQRLKHDVRTDAGGPVCHRCVINSKHSCRVDALVLLCHKLVRRNVYLAARAAWKLSGDGAGDCRSQRCDRGCDVALRPDRERRGVGSFRVMQVFAGMAARIRRRGERRLARRSGSHRRRCRAPRDDGSRASRVPHNARGRVLVSSPGNRARSASAA